MIKILKTGSWALGGTQVIELVAGESWSFGPTNDCDLVSAGWAEWAIPKLESEAYLPAKNDSNLKRAKAK